MKKFNDWMEQKLNEDPLQTMQMMRQQMGKPTNSFAKAALAGGKIAADSISGGLVGNMMDFAQLLFQFYGDYKSKEDQSRKNLEKIIKDYSKLNIPEGTFDFDVKIFNLLSNQTILKVFSQALIDIQAMDGNYKNAKFIFNEKARNIVVSTFKGIQGRN